MAEGLIFETGEGGILEDFQVNFQLIEGGEPGNDGMNVGVLQGPLQGRRSVDLGVMVGSAQVPPDGFHGDDPQTRLYRPGNGLLDLLGMLLPEIVGRQNHIVDLGIHGGGDHLGFIPVSGDPDETDLAGFFSLDQRVQDRLVEGRFPDPYVVVVIDIYVIQPQTLEAGVNLLGIGLSGETFSFALR